MRFSRLGVAIFLGGLAAPSSRPAMKGQATEDLAAFFSLRRRLSHQILRRVSDPTTGRGGKVAPAVLLSSASGTGSRELEEIGTSLSVKNARSASVICHPPGERITMP
jgi:hypothetical protein